MALSADRSGLGQYYRTPLGVRTLQAPPPELIDVYNFGMFLCTDDTGADGDVALWNIFTDIYNTYDTSNCHFTICCVGGNVDDLYPPGGNPPPNNISFVSIDESPTNADIDTGDCDVPIGPTSVCWNEDKYTWLAPAQVYNAVSAYWPCVEFHQWKDLQFELKKAIDKAPGPLHDYFYYGSSLNVYAGFPTAQYYLTYWQRYVEDTIDWIWTGEPNAYGRTVGDGLQWLATIIGKLTDYTI